MKEDFIELTIWSNKRKLAVKLNTITRIEEVDDEHCYVYIEGQSDGIFIYESFESLMYRLGRIANSRD